MLIGTLENCGIQGLKKANFLCIRLSCLFHMQPYMLLGTVPHLSGESLSHTPEYVSWSQGKHSSHRVARGHSRLETWHDLLYREKQQNSLSAPPCVRALCRKGFLLCPDTKLRLAQGMGATANSNIFFYQHTEVTYHLSI